MLETRTPPWSMGFLRSIESRIEGAFEGTFGRVFRANVEPVELARKLAKELEDGKIVSVSRVYVPNEYTVYLHPKDRDRFSEYEASLRTELALYLAEHARREGYVMATRPRVVFETEPALSLGTFGISTQMVSPDAELEEAPAAEQEQEPEPEAVAEPAAEPEPEELPEPAEAPLPEPEPEPEPVPLAVAAEPEAALPEAAAADAEARLDAPTTHFTAEEVSAAAGDAALVIDGRRVPLAKATTVLGRSSACDVVLDDPNASRRHAELRRRSGGAVVVDLDSTNGTAVNGRRVREQALRDGDRITIGTTTLVFERRSG